MPTGPLESRVECLTEAGTLEPEDAREPGAEAIKRLPGPVSWLGSGAVNGSRRYLLAFFRGMTSVTDLEWRARRKTGLGNDMNRWIRLNVPTPYPRWENPWLAALARIDGVQYQLVAGCCLMLFDG